MLDRVHGAGRPGAVLVGGAGIIYIFPALAPDDGFPTVRTFQKAAEQMELPALWGCPGIAEQEGLHPVKGFVGDDGLVGIGDAHPFFLRHSLDLVYLVAFHPAAALHQIPGINGIFQNVIDNLTCFPTWNCRPRRGNRIGSFLFGRLWGWVCRVRSDKALSRVWWFLAGTARKSS